MAIIDALRSGVDLANASNQGVIDAAKARYAFPMAANGLDKLRLANQYQALLNEYYAPDVTSQINYRNSETRKNNITNQFLPDQLRFGNEYQGLVNKEYIPEKESEINFRNAETKFTPLKYAIEASNSVRNSSRFGDAAQLIRSVNSMKSGDQELYLSDPDNNAAYMSALKLVQSGVNTPQSEILNPGFLKQFGFTGGVSNQGGIAASAPNGQSYTSNNGAVSPGNGSINLQQSQGIASAPLPVQNAVVQHIADNAPNQTIPYNQRTLLARQSLANQKLAGGPLWNRAQGAVILEKFLNDNQNTFAPRLENAAKYAGALGRGKLFADRLAKESPDTYIDYQWVMKDFIPNLGNNVKVMEKLASSDQQRKALNEMQSAAFNWDVDPKGAVKLLNMGFDLFHKQAKSTLEAAQPVVPGVLEKLNGIKSDSGNYIKNKSETIRMIGPDNSLWEVPKAQVQIAMKRGARRIS